MQRPKVVIIGGGFAGIAAARAFKGEPLDVVVIDRTNHHVFQPLLYQVATATLAPSDIAVPIRWILRKQDNVRVVMGEVTAIDVEAKQVMLDDGARIESYDFLIVASGARHAYFGHDEWEPHAPGLKSLDDALEIRNRFLQSVRARRDVRRSRRTGGAADDRHRRRRADRGGAGRADGDHRARRAAARLPTHRHAQDARPPARRGEPDPAGLPESLSAEALRDLSELGVEIRLDSIVTRIEDDAVYVGDERIPTRAVFWAAGNAASPLGGMLGAHAGPGRARGRRGATCRSPGTPRSSWRATSPRCIAKREAGPRCGAGGQPGGGVGGEERPAHACATSRASRFATSTRATWRRSAAIVPSPTSA